jgi:hypothetical protein
MVLINRVKKKGELPVWPGFPTSAVFGTLLVSPNSVVKARLEVPLVGNLPWYLTF